MRSLRYLNTVLTLIALLLTAHLATMWLTSPATLAREAQAAPVTNSSDVFRTESLQAYKQLNDSVKATNEKLDTLIGMFKSGAAKVTASGMPKEKDGQ